MSEAYLRLDGWAGRRLVPIQVVGTTTKRVRVRLLEDAMLPRGRRGRAGDLILVPHYAVTRTGPAQTLPLDPAKEAGADG